MSSTPPYRVFVSYTGEDLDRYADVVADVVRKLEWICVDHRDWGAVGNPSVEECGTRVGECDILVVLVAHRYGWVPPVDQGGDGSTSITWFEVRWARADGLRVLPYLVDPDHPWPPDHMEGLRDRVALERLERFKAELSESVCGFFTDPASLRGSLAVDLWKAGAELAGATKAKSHIAGSQDQGGRDGVPLAIDWDSRARTKSPAVPEYRYQPVTIRFQPRSEGTYVLRAESAHGGVEARSCSLDHTQLASQLWAAAEQPGGVLRRAQISGGDETLGLLPAAADVKRVGERLHHSLFGSDVGPWLDESLGSVNRQRRSGVRFVIDTTHSPELAELPWEFLYDPVREDFLFSDDLKPVVRWFDVDQATPSLAVEPPLRLLVAIAAPQDRPDLSIGTELTHLAHELEGLEREGLIHVTLLHETSLNRLDESLTREEPHVLHFVGHGDFSNHEGVVIFEADGSRSSRLISGPNLAIALRPHLAYLRLVFLNSCLGATASRRDPFGGVAQSLIRRGVPAVIAMQFPIRDHAAVVLARQFYRYVAAGRPIDAALTSARAFLFAESDVEWGSPALHMQSADGRLFQVDGTAVPDSADGSDRRVAARTGPVSAESGAPKQRARRSRIGAVSLIAAMLLVGLLLVKRMPQNGMEPPEPPDVGPVPAAIVTASEPGAIAVGGSIQLDALPIDEAGQPMANVTLAWSSNDPDVATVSPGGVVTAVRPGRTQILASAGDQVAVYNLTVLASESGGGGANPDQPSSITTYEVRAGDHLWGIAGLVYGDPGLWPLIYDANRERISDPDLIYPSQNLVIPRGLSAATQRQRLVALWAELR